MDGKSNQYRDTSPLAGGSAIPALGAIPVAYAGFWALVNIVQTFFSNTMSMNTIIRSLKKDRRNMWYVHTERSFILYFNWYTFIAKGLESKRKYHNLGPRFDHQAFPNLFSNSTLINQPTHLNIVQASFSNTMLTKTVLRRLKKDQRNMFMFLFIIC